MCRKDGLGFQNRPARTGRLRQREPLVWYLVAETLLAKFKNKFCISSRLQNALKKGIFKGEIHPLKLKFGIVDKDDDMNPYDTNQIQNMPTPWGETVTRASASKLADGAAACVLMNNHGLGEYIVNDLFCVARPPGH